MITKDDTLSMEKDIKMKEDNLRFLRSQADHLDESILDLQVSLGNYYSTSTPIAGDMNYDASEETKQEIMKQEETAASLFYQVKTRHPVQVSIMTLTKDILGVVATLAAVDNDNLSRSYVGGFVDGDPQKKLALPKPNFPNGSSPAGFLDFAVNMINIDTWNLSCATPNGHGVRETLFYALFSHLQVYRTRTDMLHALPNISEGALSLDGGMIKKNGVFALGNTNDVEVKFPVVSNKCNVTENYSRIEDEIRKLRWDQLNVAADMRREQSLLDKIKGLRL